MQEMLWLHRRISRKWHRLLNANKPTVWYVLVSFLEGTNCCLCTNLTSVTWLMPPVLQRHGTSLRCLTDSKFGASGIFHSVAWPWTCNSGSSHSGIVAVSCFGGSRLEFFFVVKHFDILWKELIDIEENKWNDPSTRTFTLRYANGIHSGEVSVRSRPVSFRTFQLRPSVGLRIKVTNVLRPV